MAVLKIQFKRLVSQHDTTDRGVIFTKDLLDLIDRYEKYNGVILLTEIQKKAILPYTKTNPDLEMTPDDILNLLKLVCPPPSPVVSLSAPSTSNIPPVLRQQPSLDFAIRPRTSPPLKTNKSTPWKRRPSAVASSIHDRNELDSIIASPATKHANHRSSTIKEELTVSYMLVHILCSETHYLDIKIDKYLIESHKNTCYKSRYTKRR